MTRFLAVFVFGIVIWGAFQAGVSAQNLIILDVEDDAEAIEFDQPLSDSDPVIGGKSLKELISGRPLFPPIEGLPEEVWGERSCNDCHQWDQETLCTQAQFYLSEAGKVGLSKIHPYGGGFKQAVRSWGAQGCE